MDFRTDFSKNSIEKETVIQIPDIPKNPSKSTISGRSPTNLFVFQLNLNKFYPISR
jgi:hypothetical protein